MSRTTVAKNVKSLEERELIETHPTTVTLKSGEKRNGNLEYIILPIDNAVDCYNRKQLRNRAV